MRVLGLPVCDHPDRLTARLFTAFRVDCACCVFWRGVALGIGFALVVATGVLLYVCKGVG